MLRFRLRRLGLGSGWWARLVETTEARLLLEVAAVDVGCWNCLRELSTNRLHSTPGCCTGIVLCGADDWNGFVPLLASVDADVIAVVILLGGTL